MNKTKSEIITAHTDAINAATSNTGVLTDAEVLLCQNAGIDVVYSINPDTKPTPKIKFKNS